MPEKTASHSFYIHIYYQHNCSWQGEIRWMDQGHGGSLYFRSFLEMTMMIKKALEKCDQNNENFRTWENTAKIETTNIKKVAGEKNAKKQKQKIGRNPS